MLKGYETAKTQTQAGALKELENEAFATGVAYRIKEQLRRIRRAETSQAARWRSTNFLKYARVDCRRILPGSGSQGAEGIQKAP